METYLGIDVGSVSTKFAVLDKNAELVTKLYLLTEGKPVTMVQQGLKQPHGSQTSEWLLPATPRRPPG